MDRFSASDRLIYFQSQQIPMEEILSVNNLKKYFTKKGSSGVSKDITRVADGISFSIKNGETLVLAHFR